MATSKSPRPLLDDAYAHEAQRPEQICQTQQLGSRRVLTARRPMEFPCDTVIQKC